MTCADCEFYGGKFYCQLLAVGYGNSYCHVTFLLQIAVTAVGPSV